MPATARALVITVSDSVAGGSRPDASGPEACRLLREAGLEVEGPQVVPDDRAAIAGAIRAGAARSALVVTTGGTGLAARDVTPEATRDVLEREAPGIAELLRAHGARQTPLAPLARGLAGRGGDVPGREPAWQPGGRARRSGGAAADPRSRVEAAGGPHRARHGRYWIHEEEQEEHEEADGDGGEVGQRQARHKGHGLAGVGHIKSQGTRAFRKGRTGGKA
jgi:molybdenum cofactor synthesis domain-containing protein